MEGTTEFTAEGNPAGPRCRMTFSPTTGLGALVCMTTGASGFPLRTLEARILASSFALVLALSVGTGGSKCWKSSCVEHCGRCRSVVSTSWRAARVQTGGRPGKVFAAVAALKECSIARRARFVCAAADMAHDDGLTLTFATTII
jgi:hypothetical protein